MIIAFLFAFGGYRHFRNIRTAHNVRIASQYHFASAVNLSNQNVKGHVDLMSKPGNKQKILQRGFNNNVKKGFVQPQRIAIARNKPTYVEVSQNNRTVGWLNSKNLFKPNQFLLHYVYYSQFWPSPAPDACEIASLKTAMSVKHKALNVPLEEMVQQIPRATNPNKGYTHDPYKYGSHATINPDAMIKTARLYGANAQNISGASKKQFIYEIERGNPVVCEVPYMASKPKSDHDVVLAGYRNGYFLVIDPFARNTLSTKSAWVSANKVMKEFKAPFRQQHALIIK